jgi:hypothetical protein
MTVLFGGRRTAGLSAACLVVFFACLSLEAGFLAAVLFAEAALAAVFLFAMIMLLKQFIFNGSQGRYLQFVR